MVLKHLQSSDAIALSHLKGKKGSMHLSVLCFSSLLWMLTWLTTQEDSHYCYFWLNWTWLNLAISHLPGGGRLHLKLAGDTPARIQPQAGKLIGVHALFSLRYAIPASQIGNLLIVGPLLLPGELLCFLQRSWASDSAANISFFQSSWRHDRDRRIASFPSTNPQAPSARVCPSL